MPKICVICFRPTWLAINYPPDHYYLFGLVRLYWNYRYKTANAVHSACRRW